MATVNWAHSFEQALRQAEQEGKLVFLDFYAPM
jgi:thiol:disulfide interchange protein